MRQRRIATLTAPFPAAQGQQMRTMRAVDLQGDRRNEGARVAIACLAASTGKSLLEMRGHLTIGIGEVTGGGVAVIRSND